MAIRYEQDGEVVVICLDRPERANALDPSTWSALADAWDRFEAEESARVAVVTGAPHRWFSAGFDVAAIEGGGDERMLLPEGALRDVYYWGRRRKPVVAAINGAAIGGGAFMAFQADMRVIAEDTFVSLPEVDYGRATGWQLFPQEQMPAAIASELVAGLRVSARRLYDAGLMNRICPAADVLDDARVLAHELAAKPPAALAAALQLVRSCRQGNLDLLPGVAEEGERLDAALLAGDEHRRIVAESLRARSERSAIR